MFLSKNTFTINIWQSYGQHYIIIILLQVYLDDKQLYITRYKKLKRKQGQRIWTRFGLRRIENKRKSGIAGETPDKWLDSLIYGATTNIIFGGSLARRDAMRESRGEQTTTSAPDARRAATHRRPHPRLSDRIPQRLPHSSVKTSSFSCVCVCVFESPYFLPDPINSIIMSVDAKKMKAVIKEGGKKGVEIQGVSEMGGLEFFCTKMDEPEGNLDLLVKAMEAMNAPCAEDAEERKGGSGNVGKMIFSCDNDRLCLVAYVPKELSEKIDVKVWLDFIVSKYGGKLYLPTEETLAKAEIDADPDNGKFTLKIRDEALKDAIQYLISKGAFPEDDPDEGSSDMVFGDDFDPDADC